MNRDKKVKLSVVIPTYNRASILQRCLKSLDEQNLSHDDFEIILIDDGSTDLTPDVVKTFKNESDITVVYQKQKNKGPATARNKGISLARGEIIWITGDDYIAEPNCLAEHLTWHQVKYPDENAIVLGFSTWHPELKVNDIMYWVENGGIQFYYYKLKHDTEISYFQFITCNISFKKSFFEKYGPFNEKYPFAMGEDTDLGIRFAYGGIRLHYNQKAVAYHYHPLTEEDNFKRCILLGKTLVTQENEWPGLHTLGYDIPLPKHFIFKMIFLVDKLFGDKIRRLPLKYRRKLLHLIFKAKDKKGILVGIREGLEEDVQKEFDKPKKQIVYVCSTDEEETFYRLIPVIKQDYETCALGLMIHPTRRSRIRLNHPAVEWAVLKPEEILLSTIFTDYKQKIKSEKIEEVILLDKDSGFDWKAALFFKLSGVKKVTCYNDEKRKEPISYKSIFLQSIQRRRTFLNSLEFVFYTLSRLFEMIYFLCMTPIRIVFSVLKKNETNQSQ